MGDTEIQWTDKLKKRFWSYVKIGEPNECWPWTGSKNGRGYGMMRIARKAFMSHRLSLELKLGRPIAPKMNSCHSCDNPPCCNQDHLFEGTQKENLDDCRAKGRAALKLSDFQVSEIRFLYVPRIVSMDKLAAIYGVTKSQIWHIIQEKQRVWEKRA